MKLHAARMRRWILLGMPLVAAGQYLGHAGGLCLLLWLTAGWLQKTPLYPYPRKRNISFSRFLLAFAGGLFPLQFFSRYFPHPLALPGISSAAVLSCAFFLNLRLPEKYRYTLALLLFIVCM